MTKIRPEFVEFIPKDLTPGVLYISERYRTASHLCACGCGEKVVTPLSPARWQLSRNGNRVSLHPSIGNWNYPCRSHYWIKANEVVWSGELSATRIASVQERDRRDTAREVAQRNREKLQSSPMPRPATPHRNTPPPDWIERLANRIARLLGLI